jgi:hypothetical protein
MQGALLAGARLEGASLKDVSIWMAVPPELNTVVGAGIVPRVCDTAQKQACEWSDQSTEELKTLISNQVPEGKQRNDALIRIQDRFKEMKSEKINELSTSWEALKGASPAPDIFETSLVGQWRAAGCQEEGAPYVLRALLGQLKENITQIALRIAVAKAFLDEDHCAGSLGLSKADKAALRAIRDAVPPPLVADQSTVSPQNNSRQRRVQGFLVTTDDGLATKNAQAPGLDGRAEFDEVLGKTNDPALQARYEQQELKRFAKVGNAMRG